MLRSQLPSKLQSSRMLLLSRRMAAKCLTARFCSANVWSMSFIDPESPDFTTRKERSLYLAQPEDAGVVFPIDVQEIRNTHDKQWSGLLSFESPETDFTTSYKAEQGRNALEDFNNLDEEQFAPPSEKALGAVPLAEYLDEVAVKELKSQHETSGGGSGGGTPSGSGGDSGTPSKPPEQPKKNALPKSLEEFYANPHDDRALVVTHIDDPYAVVAVNDAWVKMCGYTKEESHGKSLSKLLGGPATDHERLHDFVLQLVEGHDASTTITNYTKDGRKFVNHLTAAPIHDPKHHYLITHFVAAVEDVNHELDKAGSEQVVSAEAPKQAEQVISSEAPKQEQQMEELPLPKSLEEFHAHGANDSRALVVTNIDAPFAVVDVNDAWVKLCGYSKEESHGKSLSTLLGGPATDHERLHDFVLQLVEGHEASTTIINYTKEGRKFINRLHAAPIHDPKHHYLITHFVASLQDVGRFEGDDCDMQLGTFP